MTLLTPSSSNIKNTLTILVVEDDEKFADMLVQIIEHFFRELIQSMA
jgi:hypothetical protein